MEAMSETLDRWFMEDAQVEGMSKYMTKSEIVKELSKESKLDLKKDYIKTTSVNQYIL